MRTFNQILADHKKIDYNPFISEHNHLQVGDYVFATKYLDADPNDRWRVDIIERIHPERADYRIYFKETGIIPFKYAQKITAEEGEFLIQYMQMCENKPIEGNYKTGGYYVKDETYLMKPGTFLTPPLSQSTTGIDIDTRV